MAAEPKPNPKPDKFDQFIADHQARYLEAVDRCREAEMVTSQLAWRANYEAQLKLHKKATQRCVESIVLTLDTIKKDGTAEEKEKQIKDDVKALAEEREGFFAWDCRAIAPYRRSVEHAENIRMDMIRAAAEIEEKQKLIYAGLVDCCKDRARMWPLPTWDNETGRVNVEG